MRKGSWPRRIFTCPSIRSCKLVRIQLQDAMVGKEVMPKNQALLYHVRGHAGYGMCRACMRISSRAAGCALERGHVGRSYSRSLRTR